MQKAQQRDASRLNKYAFRRNIFPAEAFGGAYDMSSRPVSPPGQRGTGTPGGTTASSRQSSAPSSPTAGTFRSARQGPVGNGNGATQNGSNGYSHNPHARDASVGSTRSECASPVDEEEDVALMSVDEIINGKGEFPGLMGLVNAYLNSLNVDLVTKCELRRYLDLIKLRARGESDVSRGSWQGLPGPSSPAPRLRVKERS
jgi:glutamate--cysteine ligase catalytic subunit